MARSFSLCILLAFLLIAQMSFSSSDQAVGQQLQYSDVATSLPDSIAQASYQQETDVALVSMEELDAWHDSQAYQDLIPLRQESRLPRGPARRRWQTGRFAVPRASQANVRPPNRACGLATTKRCRSSSAWSRNSLIAPHPTRRRPRSTSVRSQGGRRNLHRRNQCRHVRWHPRILIAVRHRSARPPDQPTRRWRPAVA